MERLIALIILVLFAYVNPVLAQPEKMPGWVVAYEQDTSIGQDLRGSAEGLANAIRSGADVKFSLNDGQVFPCQQTNETIVNNAPFISCDGILLDVISGGGFRNPPFLTYTRIDTNGLLAQARASIYGGSRLGETMITFQGKITWYARVR